MNKPLSEWTLGEIKAECEKHKSCTAECPAYSDRLESEHLCRIRYFPNTWDLSEPPRWTEQDKEDAKAIKRIYQGFWVGVKRESPTRLHTIGIDGYPSRDFIDPKMFPSLKPGESVMFDEIIGGTNE